MHGVIPGEEAPTDGNWKTLLFLPGVHNIGLNFRLHSNRFFFHLYVLRKGGTRCKEFFDRSYYIPGDAIVYGTMNNGGKSEHGEEDDGDNIRCFLKCRMFWDIS